MRMPTVSSSSTAVMTIASPHYGASPATSTHPEGTHMLEPTPEFIGFLALRETAESATPGGTSSAGPSSTSLPASRWPPPSARKAW